MKQYEGALALNLHVGTGEAQFNSLDQASHEKDDRVIKDVEDSYVTVKTASDQKVA